MNARTLCLSLTMCGFSSCFGCLPPFDGPTGGGGGSGGGGGTTGAFVITGYITFGEGTGPDGVAEVRKGATLLGTAPMQAGNFTLTVDPGGPTALLVSVKAPGFNPLHRQLAADATGTWELRAQLVALHELQCAGARCETADGLRVDGLPAGTVGHGRAFNPVTETAAFPGNFDDTEGNLLQSGVFATVELENAAGQPVTELAQAAALRLPYPPETWPLLVDLAAADGRVTVPLYYFDEALGTWKREGEGELQTEAGAAVAESAIAAIRAGTFAGPLFIAGQVRHFSTWNVDWPISSHGCVTGRIVTGSRQPQREATVEIEGVTYTGRSPAMVTGADGRFCADVLRSELPGEDVNRNDVTGEQQRVTGFVTVGDKVYDARVHAVPTTEATCGGACFDLGDVVLDASSEFVAALCTITGKAYAADGSPLANEYVQAGSVLDSATVATVCPDLRCASAQVMTDADGAFSASIAVREKALLSMVRTSTVSAQTTRVEHGFLVTRGCPRAPVRLQMGPVQLITMLQVTVSGQVISWSPPVELSLLMVSAEQPRWGFSGKFNPPVTFGQLPSGSTQLYPPAGPLSSGDEVAVAGARASGGVTETFSGSYTVP